MRKIVNHCEVFHFEEDGQAKAGSTAVFRIIPTLHRAIGRSTVLGAHPFRVLCGIGGMPPLNFRTGSLGKGTHQQISTKAAGIELPYRKITMVSQNGTLSPYEWRILVAKPIS
jgi:hypothetical protein